MTLRGIVSHHPLAVLHANRCLARTTVYRTSARKDRSSTTWVSCRDQTKVVEIASHRDSVKVSFAQNATELTAFAATQFRAPLLNVVTASSKITTSSASGRPPKASIKAPVITTTNTIARYRGVEHKEPRLKYDDVFKLEQKAGYSKGHMGHCFHPKERVHWMKEVEALDCGRVLGRDIQGWTFVPWGLF